MKNTIKIQRKSFYFVRHGQTDWNNENKVMGQIDIPLNAIGLEQAQEVAQHLAHHEISHIVSSPLKRALQTSEIIAATMNRPITVIKELTQNNLGILEGRNKEELFEGTSIGNLIEQWKMGGDIAGAEHWSTFVTRIAAGLNAALASNSDEKPILIVAHKPVYWALLHILNAHVVDIHAKNCGLYYFSPSSLHADRWEIEIVH